MMLQRRGGFTLLRFPLIRPATTIAASAAMLFLAPIAMAWRSSTPWSGPYLGLFVGYDDANNAWTPDGRTGGPSLSPEGVLGGGFAGGNFQFDALVVGVEADLMFADFSSIEPCENMTADCSFDRRLMGSLRARAGLAFDRALIYVTGGPAFSYVRATSSGLAGSSDSQILAGWTAGIGGEIPIGDHLRLGVEYRHTDYGRSDFALSPGVSGNVDFETDEATLRLTIPLE